MSRRRSCRGLASLLLVLTASLTLPAVGQADGGLLLAYRLIGPYDVLVYASPPPYLTGLSVDISVLIDRAPAGAVILNAQAVLRATPIGHAAPTLSFPATHTQATNPAFYAANVRLPAGQWQVVADLRDGSWAAQVPFQLEVTQPGQRPRFPLRTVAAWLAALFVLGGALVVAIHAGRHDGGDIAARR